MPPTPTFRRPPPPPKPAGRARASTWRTASSCAWRAGTPRWRQTTMTPRCCWRLGETPLRWWKRRWQARPRCRAARAPCVTRLSPLTSMSLGGAPGTGARGGGGVERVVCGGGVPRPPATHVCLPTAPPLTSHPSSPASTPPPLYACSFYSAVSASGLTDAVQSLSSGGAPPRWVVIDDGWQCTDVDAPYRSTPTEKLAEIGSTVPQQTVGRVWVWWVIGSTVPQQTVGSERVWWVRDRHPPHTHTRTRACPPTHAPPPHTHAPPPTHAPPTHTRT